MSNESKDALNQAVTVGEVSFAFRRFGAENGVPLVLLQRFRGTMDDWDPDLLDALAATRPVIIFDNEGIGRSSGRTPPTVEGMAEGAARFITTLGRRTVDILGWSLGGSVGQALALSRPDLVRKLVVAGSSPGHVQDAPAVPPKVWQVAGKLENEDEDFLYLFFRETEAGRQAGRAHLARLRQRPEAFTNPVSLQSMQAQAAAIAAFSEPGTSLLEALANLTCPAFVANGYDDVMVPAFKSYVMARAMPRAKLTIYPDSGHGFLFQYAREFAQDISIFFDN